MNSEGARVPGKCRRNASFKRAAQGAAKRIVSGFMANSSSSSGAVQPKHYGMWAHLQLSGIAQPRGTFWNHSWNGTPLSRAKANSCRDAVAILVMPFAVERMTMMDVIAVAPPFDPVAL